LKECPDSACGIMDGVREESAKKSQRKKRGWWMNYAGDPGV